MMTENGIKRVYVYKMGPFTLSIIFLFSCFCALFGLFLIVDPIFTGALEDLFLAVLWGVGFLFVAALFFRLLHQDFLSSQTVVLWPTKVQLPITKGEEDSDYLFLNDVLGTKIDKDFHEHGPALIVATKTKPVVYKSMYFDKYKSFEDFCECFASALADNNSRKPNS